MNNHLRRWHEWIRDQDRDEAASVDWQAVYDREMPRVYNFFR